MPQCQARQEKGPVGDEMLSCKAGSLETLQVPVPGHTDKAAQCPLFAPA